MITDVYLSNPSKGTDGDMGYGEAFSITTSAGTTSISPLLLDSQSRAAPYCTVRYERVRLAMNIANCTPTLTLKATCSCIFSIKLLLRSLFAAYPNRVRCRSPL
jgi:hypothetical protein